MSLRNVTPAARSRSTSAAMSATIRWMRFQPPGPGLRPVGHGSPGRAGRPAQQQTQAAPGDVGERGGGVDAALEAEVLGVEVDRGLHVVDHVADVHHLVWFGHGSSCLCHGVAGAARAASRNPMRVSSSAAVCWKPRSWLVVAVRVRRRGPGCSSGRSRVAGNSGQTSRTRSHRLTTVEALGRRTRRGASGADRPCRCRTRRASPGPRSGATASDGSRRCGPRPGRRTATGPAPRPSVSARCCLCTGTAPGPAARGAPARRGGVRRSPGCSAPPVAASIPPRRARSAV